MKKNFFLINIFDDFFLFFFLLKIRHLFHWTGVVNLRAPRIAKHRSYVRYKSTNPQKQKQAGIKSRVKRAIEEAGIGRKIAAELLQQLVLTFGVHGKSVGQNFEVKT